VDSNASEPRFLANLGLMLTYRCTIACPHCVVEAGPHRKEEMRLEDALVWVEEASNYRDGHIKGIALTGGEPFYNLEYLAQISAHCRALGFIVSVVTNAFWASTRDEALNILSGLPAVQMVSVSTDVYHQQSIPFGFVQNAVWAAKELGRPYNIAVCTDNEEDQHYQKIIGDLKAMGEEGRIRLSITYPVGRARKKAHRFKYRTAPEPTVSACSMASSPVVFPDGRVIACIGPVLTLPRSHPLFLGNLRQERLSEILDRAELNPILHTIRAWGPHKLVSLLKQNGLEAMLPGAYISDCICDICYRLFSDGRIVDALERIMEDQQTRETIAYARIYYLNETRLAELYHLDVTERADIHQQDSGPGSACAAPATRPEEPGGRSGSSTR
jgi:organic radical activating enzyme